MWACKSQNYFKIVSKFLHQSIFPSWIWASRHGNSPTWAWCWWSYSQRMLVCVRVPMILCGPLSHHCISTIPTTTSIRHLTDSGSPSNFKCHNHYLDHIGCLFDGYYGVYFNDIYFAMSSISLAMSKRLLIFIYDVVTFPLVVVVVVFHCMHACTNELNWMLFPKDYLGKGFACTHTIVGGVTKDFK